MADGRAFVWGVPTTACSRISTFAQQQHPPEKFAKTYPCEEERRKGDRYHVAKYLCSFMQIMSGRRVGLVNDPTPCPPMTTVPIPYDCLRRCDHRVRQHYDC